MQTLGISESTAQSENFLKRLFWPSIRNGSDVDTLGSQGYWVCAIVAVFGCITSVAGGHPIVGVFLALYYYVGGVGVREHSRYAAVVVFIMFFVDTVFSPGIVKIFACVLLLSVLRATFIASFWKKRQADAEMPIRFGETWGDKFVDKLPAWLWPKVRIVYYIFSVSFLALTTMGLIMLALGRHTRVS
jgi:hypothetical protein